MENVKGKSSLAVDGATFFYYVRFWGTRSCAEFIMGIYGQVAAVNHVKESVKG